MEALFTSEPAGRKNAIISMPATYRLPLQKWGEHQQSLFLAKLPNHTVEGKAAHEQAVNPKQVVHGRHHTYSSQVTSQCVR